MSKRALVAFVAVWSTVAAGCGESTSKNTDGGAGASGSGGSTADAKVDVGSSSDGATGTGGAGGAGGASDARTDVADGQSADRTGDAGDAGDGATATFTVGGTISGLAGTVVLRNNLGDNLTVNAGQTAFTFATRLAAGAAYSVTVGTQPASPAQTCTVANASGTVGAANVTGVMITCSTQTFTVGGTITGLVGGGLVLGNSGGDNLTVPASAGTFTFATSVASGAAYAVTVLTQPSSPTQSCTVANGTGTVGAANVTGVAITCVTGAFTIGGTVVGLTGSGLVLKNNGGDALTVNSGSTSFTFATSVHSGEAFAITIDTQPSSPVQTCSVIGGSGTVGAANVATVTINCSVNSFVIGGTISGLAGTVVLQNNGGDSRSISSNGSFSFPTPVSSGGNYAVTVLTQPGTPSQTCTVASGTGAVTGADITSVAVTCVTNTYHVHVDVSGLAGSGLVLENNAGDSLPVSASGNVSFATAVASGSAYLVTVAAQPSGPTQSCTVTAGSGTIAAADVTAMVTCSTSHFAVGGTITGLATGAIVTLQNGGGDDLPVSANGAFVFQTSVASGAAYAVTVLAQPSTPTQICTVTSGAGTVGGGAVTSVAVNCVTSTYAVHAVVSGLGGTGLVLDDNGGNSLPVSGNGTVTFTAPVASGAPYAVTVSAQPSGPTQVCTVTGGAGTIGNADVTVSVSCVTSSFAVGGTISGLAGTGLVIRNNGGNDLSVTGNGTFTFPTAVLSGAAYAVTVGTQPSGPTQTCAVSNAAGTVGGGAVTSVVIVCVTNSYFVRATVSGLAGSGLVLNDNGGDALTVSTSGTVTFATPVQSGAPYAVTVATQPSGPTQVCTVTGGSGTIDAANVSATVTCVTSSFTVGGTVAGLVGGGLVLRNNGGDNRTITGNGAFTFATPVASGATYAVTVFAQPTGPTQTCAVTNGAGTVGAGAVTNVSVVCVTNTYSVRATVSGLAGSGLHLHSGADDVTVTANGTVTFPTAVASGATYAVTASPQPSSPTQTCTVTSGTGTIASADVTATVTCVTNNYALQATVSGLTGSGFTLRNNAGTAVPVPGNGTVTIAASVASGSTYAITVGTQPSSPAQTCTVGAPATGTVGAANVVVTVTCTTNTYSVTGTLSGAALGTSVTLRNNGGDAISVTNGAFTFPTALASGTTYAVTATTPSYHDTCVVTGGTGTITTANATVTVSCPSNLMYYFPFDGNGNDASGKGNNATVNGATLTTDRTGAANKAYAFTTGQWIQAPGTSLPTGASARTLTAWVKMGDTHGQWGFIHWGNGDCTGLMWGLGYQGAATFWGGCMDFAGGPTIALNTWTFAAIRFTPPSTYRMWVNATAVDFTLGSTNTTASNLWIGGETTDNGNFRNYFVGSLDSIRIYNRALTDAEVSTIFTTLP